MAANLIADRLTRSADLNRRVAADAELTARVGEIAERCVAALRTEGAVYWCGNGGSAADAQHLAAELTGRFYYDRPPLRSEALHVNTSFLTAVANDYGFEHVYSRLVRAQVRRGDVVIGLSTSGNSDNVVRALAAARDLGATTVGMTGDGGGDLAEHCDVLVAVPSTDTPRIQEVHLALGHCVCELVEAALFLRPS